MEHTVGYDSDLLIMHEDKLLFNKNPNTPIWKEQWLSHKLLVSFAPTIPATNKAPVRIYLFYLSAIYFIIWFDSIGDTKFIIEEMKANTNIILKLDADTYNREYSKRVPSEYIFKSFILRPMLSFSF